MQIKRTECLMQAMKVAKASGNPIVVDTCSELETTFARVAALLEIRRGILGKKKNIIAEMEVCPRILIYCSMFTNKQRHSCITVLLWYRLLYITHLSLHCPSVSPMTSRSRSKAQFKELRGGWNEMQCVYCQINNNITTYMFSTSGRNRWHCKMFNNVAFNRNIYLREKTERCLFFIICMNILYFIIWNSSIKHINFTLKKT